MTFLRFILAMLVAIAGGLLRWSHPWRRVKGAFYLWWDSRYTIQADNERFRERMAACKQCPIYFRPLMTCGTPLRRHSNGCWCFQPYKNRMYSATCWLRDHEPNRTGYGWRDGL